MRRLRPTLIAALAFGAIGCRLGPDYHPPDMTLPPEWRQPAPTEPP